MAMPSFRHQEEMRIRELRDELFQQKQFDKALKNINKHLFCL